MTDRELLERAAKATGWLTRPDGYGGYLIAPETGGWKQWNPLTDDGDALRLAVKLNFRVDAGYVGCADVYGTLGSCVQATEVLGGDPYAATRRAIVRAAAAMEPR